MDIELQLATWGLLADKLLNKEYDDETKEIVKNISLANINNLKKELNITDDEVFIPQELKNQKINKKYEYMVSKTEIITENALSMWSGIYAATTSSNEEELEKLSGIILATSIDNIISIIEELPPSETIYERKKLIPKNVLDVIGEIYARSNKKR